MSKIAVYKSDITGKEVFLNLDPRHFQWVHQPSQDEIAHLIAEWERVRIDILWQKLEKPQNQKNIIAFRTLGIGSLMYFRRSVVMRAFKITLEENCRQISQYICRHTIEQQVEILHSIKPTNWTGLKACIGIKSIVALFPVDLASLLASVGTIHQLVDKIQLELATNTVPRHHSSPYRELLMMLRARGWLLYPAEYNEWATGGNIRWLPFNHEGYAGPLFPMFEEIGVHLTNAEGIRTERSGIGLVMLAITSASSVDDLSRVLIDAAEEVMYKVQVSKEATGSYIKRRPGSVRSAAMSFREMWNRRHPAMSFETTRVRTERADSSLLRTRGEYGWVATAAPDMESWVVPLATFIVERGGGRTKSGPISDLNWFLDFLLAHENRPHRPEDTVRHVHIHDPTLVHKNTLMERLRKSNLKTRRQQRILRGAREFFSWYLDWLHANGQADVARGFKNPITEFERLTPDNSPMGTHRKALPSWVMNELRRTLTENDFEMPRKAFNADHVPVFDKEVGSVVRTWWPGVAVSLGILLDIPLRSHQARWLDSGEYDEFTCNFMTTEEEKNSNLKAVPGRREGAMRRMEDALSDASWLGLYVNTNKTALYDGRSPNGYEVPWISAPTAQLIHTMQQWNARYLSPLAKLVTYDSEGLGKSAFAKVDTAFLPKIAPLLRDPRQPQSNIPVSRTKMARLWVAVLHETEKRVRVERRVPQFELTIIKKGQRTWKVDLHTLRVSGISAMLENGVPLEVVSQFVAGHSTLVMTLWYAKFAPEKLREHIEKASKTAHEEADFIGSDAFIENLEKFSPFLLSKDASFRGDYDPAYAALKEHTGLWSINTDGICPGTACSTGGERQPGAAEYGPVPGGRRCGLCRYWSTGPAFLLGQMAAVNNLAYEIRQKGLALAALRDRLIELEDSDERTKAHHVRTQIQARELDLGIDIAEWQKRYSYAIASSELAEDYVKTRNSLGATSQLPVPIVTACSADELKVTLREADEFLLMEHVTQTSEFMPEFKNQAAVQDKHLLLAQMLAANGIPAKYLVTLTAQQRDVAANMMSSVMLNFVEAHDMRRFASGELLLSDMEGLEPAIRELAAGDVVAVPQVRDARVIPIRAV
jgi:hypothetical protein